MLKNTSSWDTNSKLYKSLQKQVNSYKIFVKKHKTQTNENLVTKIERQPQTLFDSLKYEFERFERLDDKIKQFIPVKSAEKKKKNSSEAQQRRILNLLKRINQIYYPSKKTRFTDDDTTTITMRRKDTIKGKDTINVLEIK